MILYLAVTNDKYELPIAVEEKLTELAKDLNYKYDTVKKALSLGRPNKKRTIKYVKVEVDLMYE